jgi:UPF0755 protein
MKRALRITIESVLLLLVMAAAAGWWLYRDLEQRLWQPLELATPQRLVITPGMSARAVSEKLVRRGLIEHPYYLIYAARREGVGGRIQAGEYEIKPGMTPLDLLDMLVRGRVVQYALILVEGWTFGQALAAVRASPYLVPTANAADGATVMRALGRLEEHPEGWFFPDTYHFPAGTTDIQFLARAHRAMTRVLEEEWAQRALGLPYATPYEALIMASLIERETGIPEERPQIAGVLVRRLERGMKLQTDPTVIYALGALFDGNLRRQDLALDSPYNTYLYPGLPPTPIALPGRAAIRAALQPEPGTALYFVARGDGSHHFSETLAEHNQAVAKYQLGQGGSAQSPSNEAIIEP